MLVILNITSMVKVEYIVPNVTERKDEIGKPMGETPSVLCVSVFLSVSFKKSLISE